MVARRGGAKTKSRTAVGGVHKGEEGRLRVQQELARQKKQEAARKATRDDPFRFRMKPGEDKQFIVVDEEPWFFRYEHNMKNPKTGFYDLFLGCVRDYDNCPICEGEGKEGGYNMFLTVIDLTEFDDRNGETHEFSRKLLVVKSRDQNKMIRRFESEGTLRGALFEAHRDKDTDPAIGNDIEFIELVPEEELAEYVREYEDRDGKIHTEDCSEPLDYEKLYPPKDADELAEDYEVLAGGEASAPTPGSRRSNERGVGKSAPRRGKKEEAAEEEDDEAWEDEDEEEAPETKPARRGKRSAAAEEEPAPRRTKRRPVMDEEEEEDDEEEEAPEEKPARRTKKAAAPAGRTKRKPAIPDDEDEDEDEDEDDDGDEEEAEAEAEKPARRGRRTVSAAKPPTRRGRR